MSLLNALSLHINNRTGISLELLQSGRFVSDTKADDGTVECVSCGQNDLRFLNNNG